MSDHQPRRGDKVWDRNRFLEEQAQPNGWIEYVDWEEREVAVTFHDGSAAQYSFDELEDCWEPCFGGTYMLYPTRSTANIFKRKV